MKLRLAGAAPTDELDARQELVDAIAEAVDTGRRDEVARLRLALEPFGLGEALRDELWLSGGASGSGLCECCAEVFGEVA